MLQVFDKKSGEKADVRVMLGINNKDIRDQNLREKMSLYSMIDSQLKMDPNQIEGDVEMGFYFSELDTLQFDMGEVGEESLKRTTSKNVESWQDWWSMKI